MLENHDTVTVNLTTYTKVMDLITDPKVPIERQSAIAREAITDQVFLRFVSAAMTVLLFITVVSVFTFGNPDTIWLWTSVAFAVYAVLYVINEWVGYRVTRASLRNTRDAIATYQYARATREIRVNDE